MTKVIRFFGWVTIILFVLVGIAATSDYWEKFLPFHEGGFIWSLVFFFSTAGVGLLAICLLLLLILIFIDSRKTTKSAEINSLYVGRQKIK